MRVIPREHLCEKRLHESEVVRSLRPSINFLAVADLYDLHKQLIIVDDVYDAVISLTDPIPIPSGRFLATDRSWVGSKNTDARKKLFQIFLRKSAQLFFC